MSFNTVKRPLAAGIASVFLLSACATNPDGSFKLDEKATGALIGAAAGCAVGAAAGKGGAKGCLVGAAIGAAAGYMIGWYFESRKIASAQEVNREYEQQGKGKAQGKAKGKTDVVPKNDVVPAKFDTQINAVPPDAQGQREVQITSNTDLIGYGDKVPVVQQKYAIYDEQNNLVEEKTETVTAVDGAGRFQTNSKFKLPANAQGKNYTVKTTLMANNKVYKENPYKITVLDGQILQVAALY